MDRGGALIGDRRRLLLEHGDRYAAPVEREGADHADRPGTDDDRTRMFRHSATNLDPIAGRMSNGIVPEIKTPPSSIRAASVGLLSAA
jgi:hypothetical protein